PVAHLRRASADGALRRCGAVSGRLFSASSAQPNQVGTSGDISGTGRAPLGFDSGMFRRSEATSLPSDSTWPCSLDRATVWPCACSRRRVSEIRQGGSSCVLAELLLQEMRLDGLRSPKAAPRRAKIVVGFRGRNSLCARIPPFGGVDINPVTHRLARVRRRSAR